MLGQYGGRGRKPAAIPHAGGGWEGASARWQGNVFVPFEKLIAVLAVGQMMHIGIGELLIWTRLNKLFRRKKPKSKLQQTYTDLLKEQKAGLTAHFESGKPIVLFRSAEKSDDPGTTVLLSQPAFWLVGLHFNNMNDFLNSKKG